jgi:hypothetical protein
MSFTIIYTSIHLYIDRSIDAKSSFKRTEKINVEVGFIVVVVVVERRREDREI